MAPLVTDNVAIPKASSADSRPSTSPLLQHDVYLILTFPDLRSFLNSTQHLPVITKEAEKSNGLLVLVRFQEKVFLGFGTVDNTNGQLIEGSAGGSSTPPNASSSTVETKRQDQIYPSSIFHKLQEALSTMYSAATKAFIEDGRPLAKADIVIEELRELAVCVPTTKDVRVSKWSSKAPPPTQTHDPDTCEKATIDKDANAISKMFAVTALGGTFDHLHAGHKILLTMAAAITSQRLIVGTTDEALLTKKKFPAYIESLERRIAETTRFLQLIRPVVKHDVVAIQDVYGPTAWDPEVEALVLSEETRAGGDAINEERKNKGLSTLETFVIELISEEADVKGKVETKMGSTGIREWVSKNQPIVKQKKD